MGLYFTLVVRPIEMSQQLFNVSLQLFVFAVIFLANTGNSTFNITRYTKGDVFQNTNSSKSCNESGASCVFDGKNSPFCGINCCNCFCPSKTPTYLLRNGNCTSEDHLMSILKAQSSIQGCAHRMVVAESLIQCQNEVLPTLNTLNPGNKTLYLCPWNKKLRLIHYEFVKNLDKCVIVPEKSLYLLNGSWKRRPRHDPALSKLVVEIGQDPGFSNNRLFLKWIADIGKQYDGLIFSLKLDCRGTQGNTLTSCLHFKKGGSFTDIEPTLKPALLKSTLARSRSTFVQETTTETATTKETTTLMPTQKPTPSTAHASTSSVVVDDEGVKSLTNKSDISIVVVILAALAGGLFVLLTMLAVFFLLWRRRRQFHVGKEGKDATNPVYVRGASDTLKMAKISNGNGPAEEEWPDYQPLVENSKPRDRKDSLPGYRSLSTGQRPPNQQAASDRGIRSSNYLSLIKDDPEEGREYQTLMKDGNPQVTSKNFEIVNEEKIPDYAELEERSDSEDSFESSDSQDYEELPDLKPKSRTSHCVPTKQNLNNLSSDFHDYDEPEGVIVISDNEECQHEKAIKDNNDFHDYADPDDTDEDNVGCHVTPSEDLACYHDYDDPAE